MSSATTEVVKTVVSADQPELKVYAHSPLLYWWPVWAVALLMAAWTWAEDYHAVLVPAGTAVEGNRLVVPEGADLYDPSVHVSRSRVPGAVFVCTLLAVMIFGQAWLRGPWALAIAASLAAAAFLIGWLAWWGTIYHWVGLLRVYINLGGYLVIALPLLVVWAFTVFVLDRRTYMVFSTGQVRIRDELGEAEKVFDPTSLSFEKRPYDWFRRVVGWGAGDMVVRVGGPHPQVIEMPNVVRVGKWLRDMEARLRTRDVV